MIFLWSLCWGLKQPGDSQCLPTQVWRTAHAAECLEQGRTTWGWRIHSGISHAAHQGRNPLSAPRELSREHCSMKIRIPNPTGSGPHTTSGCGLGRERREFFHVQPLKLWRQWLDCKWCLRILAFTFFKCCAALMHSSKLHIKCYLTVFTFKTFPLGLKSKDSPQPQAPKTTNKN